MCWSCRQLVVFVFFSAPLCMAAVDSHCHMDSVCRFSSRRFSCTFLRRQQAPMTTSGWSFKPSPEYVQVCVSGFYFVKGNCHNIDSSCVNRKYWYFNHEAVTEASGTYKPD